MRFTRANYLACFILCISHLAFGQKNSYKDKNAPIETRVKNLLSQMTIEEKVAQMRIFHANLGIDLKGENELILKDTVVKRLKYGVAGIKNPGETIEPHKAAVLCNALEVKDVGFIIKPDMLKFTTLKMVRELEAGEYQVMIGTSSQTGLKEKFRLILK